MDENKIIRVILEARDGLSGAIAKARKNIDKELGGMDKSFKDFSKGVKDFEKDIDNSFDGVEKSSKKVNAATKAVDGMTASLRNLSKEARAARKDAGSIVGFGGTTLKRNRAGQFQKASESFNENFTKGFRGAVEARKNLDNLLQATEKIRKKNREILDDKFRELKVQRSIDQDIERAGRIDIIHAKQQPFRDLRVQAAKEFNAAQERGDTEEAQRQQDIYERLSDNIKSVEAQESAAITRKYQKIREEDTKVFNRAKAAIKNPDVENALKKFRAERDKILNSGTTFDRLGKRAGFALGDFFSGISRGRSDIRNLDGDLEKLSGVFGRLGFAIGGAFKDLNKLVNLRWLFLTSAITLLVNVLTQLVVVLVSVASSAILAGAALGGALVAGVAQAVPVIGLLAAAFHSLQNVIKAVQLEDKANVKSDADAKEAADKRTQAVQKLADAHYAVKQAVQSVKDANYNLIQSHKDVTLAEKDHTQAIKDLAEARKQAARDIVDANQQEKDSALALQEAELGVLQAKEKLRQEELKHRQTAVDVDQAQAAIKEAKDRLKLAQQQGDSSEIVKANQQLSLAEGNLNDIQDKAVGATNDLKDAQLGVKRAELDRQQAVVKKKRDSEDAAKARKLGIEQSQRVIDAEKQLASSAKGIADAQRNVAQAQLSVASSIHQLAISRREEADAKNALADKTNLQSTAQKNLNQAVAQFSPAEKKLYQALLRVKNAYKKAFSGTPGKDGILAPILNGFTAIADAIVKLLTDPKILKSLGKLAIAIGDGFQRFGTLLTSKDFKDDLIFFVEQATENLPKVVDILIQIFNLFRKIGREAAPIFSDLLGGVDSLLGRANKAAGEKVGSQTFAGRPEEGTRGPTATKQQTRLGSFLEGAEKHLKAWLALGKAIGRVLLLLVNASAPTGKSLVESATDALNRLGDFIEKNPEKVQKFFSSIADSFKILANALLKLTIIFGKAAQDPDIQNFAIFLIETIVPGLYLMIKAVGFVVGGLTALTKIPLLGGFIKFGLEVLIAEKALNKLFPVTQGLTNLIRKGLTKSFQGLFAIIKDPQRALRSFKDGISGIGLATEITKNKLKDMGQSWKQAGIEAATSIGRFVKLVRAQGIIVTLTSLLPALGAAFEAMWALALGPVGIVIAAIALVALGIFLLDKKFHFIRPTIQFFWNSIKAIFEWIKSHWHLVVALLTGPIGVAVLLIIKHWDKVKDLFFGFKDLLSKYYYKPVYNILIKPFVEASEFIIALFSKLPKILGKILGKIPFFGRVLKLAEKASGITGAVNIVKGANKVAGSAVGSLGKATDSADTFLGGDHSTKISPTRVINNDAKDIKLIKKLRAQGKSDAEILAFLIEHGSISRANFRKRFGFRLTDVQGYSGGSSGVIGVGNKDSVPAMLTPGEWVLNSGHIKRLARLLGVSAAQAKAQIFGTNIGRPGHPLDLKSRGLKPSKSHSPFISGSFSLIPQEDEDGNSVWFIQLADGTFGQVTARDATKIQSTNGRYIPGYVKRNSHGFSQSIRTQMNPLGFANGGIIPAGIRGFAEGGVVQSPGYSGTTNSKTINQNFNVRTEGATDWSYVMRLSAITAQSSF